MKKHSKVFEDKRSQLRKKESQLKEELDSESVKAEKSVVKFAKIFGGVLIGLGIGYLAYRILFKERAQTQKKKRKKISSTKSKSQPNPLFQRAFDQLIAISAKFIFDQIKSNLDRKKPQKEIKDS